MKYKLKTFESKISLSKKNYLNFYKATSKQIKINFES